MHTVEPAPETDTAQLRPTLGVLRPTICQPDEQAGPALRSCRSTRRCTPPQPPRASIRPRRRTAFAGVLARPRRAARSSNQEPQETSDDAEVLCGYRGSTT